ncbi:CHAT domain-containing protein [Nostoc sp. FACHB-973]|nr:CHAT domain-containing protein [Nostoc sp. FACHB-973]
MHLCFKSFKLGSVILLLLSLISSLPFLASSLLLLNAAFEFQVLAQASDSQKAQAEKLIDEGTTQFQNNQLEKAVQSFQKALDIYRKLKDIVGEGTALANLGQVYYYQQNYSKALEVLQSSFRIAHSNNDWRSSATILGIIGNTYYYLNDYDRAIFYLNQAWEIAKNIKYEEEQWRDVRNLGSIYHYLGDYAKAIEYDLLFLELSRKLKYRGGEWIALANLAANYLYLGNEEKGIDYSQQALSFVEKGSNDEGGILTQIGTIYGYLGSPKQAIDYLEKALAIFQTNKYSQGERTTLQNLSSAYGRRGDYNKATQYAQKALELAKQEKDRRIISAALGNLGLIIAAQGNYRQAIDYYRQSLAIERAIKSPQGEGASLNNLGNAYYKSGNLIEAEKVLQESIKVWESQREKLGNDDINKISIFDTQASAYKLLQEVFVAQNKTNSALEISERGRASAFVELLAKRIAPQIAMSKRVYLNLEQIKQVAKAHHSTLVQYSIVESNLYIWVIQPTGRVDFRSVNPKKSFDIALEKLVTSTRQSLGIRGGSIEVVPLDNVEAENQLKLLHQILISPIADLLPTDPNVPVIFMPQGELFLVPFPALQDEKGKYLIEQHTILTAPAIQVLDLTQQQKTKVQQTNSKEVVIVGNPTMPEVPPKIGEPPQQLASLPSAEEEAKAIAQILETKAITGNKAKKSAILPLLPKARIIHLATHGLLDDFRGLGVPGAIALAPSGNSEPNDGLLTANEILDLKLNAELVVLSACDTGRGRITGDGVIGLSRSLITAGTPSVIVSLWSVPDAPTAELMTEFYRNWLSGKLDKAQALREAMLKTRENHPNPKDWAAFTLIGEAK